MILLISAISRAYAQRASFEDPQGGRLPWLVLRCRRVAGVHPVRGLSADRSARGRNRGGAAGAPSARCQPDRRRPDARRARRGDPRAPGGGRGVPVGDRRVTRRAAAGGLLPDRGCHADAAGDRHVPRLLPRGRGDARRGRARGDRAATARRPTRPRAPVRVRRRDPAAGGHGAYAPARGPDVPGATARAPARGQGEAPPAGSRRRGLGTDVPLEPVRAPRRSQLPCGGLRAACGIRERRLPDGRGPGRGRRRRRPDPRARPVGGARGRRHPRALPRTSRPTGDRGDVPPGARLVPAAPAMLGMLEQAARELKHPGRSAD